MKKTLFSSWKQIYAVVIGALVVQILVFYFITKYFSA